MVDISKVVLSVDSRQVKNASRDLDGLDKSGQKANRMTAALGRAMMVTAAGATALAAAGGVVLRNTIKQERAVAQLESALKSTGQYTPTLSKNLREYASELQSVSTFGDEAIIGSQALLLTFRQIGQEEMPRAQKAILDVATAMGQDLNSATLQVGKALNDPILGLTALQRSGIQFTASQKEVIKQMVATGDVAGAQVKILEELESQFGGSAEAARNTLGGALTALKNTFGDLLEGDSSGGGVNGATKALNEFNDMLGSETSRAAFRAFTEGVLKAVENTVKFGRAIAKAISWMHEITGNLFNITQGFRIFSGTVSEVGRRLGFWSDSLDDLGAELVRTIPVAESLAKAAERATEKQAISAQRAAQFQEKYTEAMRKSNAEAENQIKRLNEVLDALYPQQAETQRLAEEWMFLKETLEGVDGAQRVLDDWWRENMPQAVEATKAVTHSISGTEKAVKSLTKEAPAMSTAYARGIERMRDGFGDFFQRILVDGKFAFSDLTDFFKRMVAEMVATAAANKIFIGVGLGTASMGASAAGGMGGMGGIMSSIGNFGAGAMNLVGHGASALGHLGIPGMNFLSERAFGQGMTMTGGGALMGAGAGLLGGFASNAVFGKTSGVGSGLGGLAGMALGGPLGAGIGSFLGGGIESLFGGKNNGNNAGRAQINLATGASSIGGVGKSFNQANVDQVTALAEFAQQVSGAIGGSNAALDIVSGNNSGIRVGGSNFSAGDAEGAINQIFKQVVFGASELEEPLKRLIGEFKGTAAESLAFAQMVVSVGSSLDETTMRLISSFQGTAEQTGAYIQSLSSLNIALNTDPVQAARDAYEQTGLTLSESYYTQLEGLQGLIVGYDGSMEATQNLSMELGNSKEMAFQLAQQLLAASDQISNLTQSSAENIRQSIMSEEQLRAARMEERDSLVQELERINDPAEIRDSVTKLDQLNNAIFRSLGPEQQRAQAEAFAGFIEMVNNTAQARLTQGIADLESTQTDINATIGKALDGAAGTMQTAANTMLSAAQAIPSSFNVNVNAANDVLANIRGFASGGYASPGMAMVGEQGPELVRFNKPGYVFNANETRSMMSGNSGAQSEIADLRKEMQALAVMTARQLKLWQRVTRNGESLRTTVAA